MNTKPKSLVSVMAIAGLAMLTIGAGSVWAQAGGKTVLDGAYTEAQATAGETAYKATCVNCHGAELRGGGGGAAPPLRTNEFLDRWREDSLSSVYLKIKNEMPRNARRGSLSEAEYLAIVAFILKVNEFPAGSQELTAANVAQIRLTTAEGPKPLPNNTQVYTVGCLAGSTDDWTLTKAAEPVRNRAPGAVKPEEVTTFTNMPLGAITFELRNVDLMDPPVNPEPNVGKKMLVKGVMVNSARSRRISPTGMAPIGNCQ